MIGPKGLSRVVGALRVIAPELPFEIAFLELTENEQSIQRDGYRIEAFRVNHNVTCYGYSIVVDRTGKFDVEKAKSLGIEMKYWNRLQKGETITLEDAVFTPDMVLGAKRKGLKVTYCTDTRPTQSLAEHAVGSDLLILEGMYGEPEKLKKAKENKHMTFYEAAHIAKNADVPKLWLTHYSPSLAKPDLFMPDVWKIFPNTLAAKDGQTAELFFED